ncbi:Uncharacterised protein [Escherichia coli]|nr:Uncharacterised protein [Escherichia coli]CAD5792679.1 Uncharacterised protein [Escherichia coli]CAD6048339.1 Uncharacterised protein [Escherichia coli]
MTRDTSSPENSENTPECKILRQSHPEVCARLETETELNYTKQTLSESRLMLPARFILDDFVEKYPRKLKSGKNRPPG